MSDEDKKKSGFTMVSDYLAWKYQDYQLAVIYGKIERFCTLGNDKICDAAIETFEKELVVSDTAINPRIDLLVKEGYVVDSTPDLVNRSHNRTITDKLQKEEEDFHEWAESYRNEEREKGNKLPSYYDCFVVYAHVNNIESYLSKTNQPKKARGRNGGRKPRIQRGDNQNRLDSNLPKIIDNLTEITEKSTIDYDNTIDTKETIDTFQKSETSEGRTPSSFPPASVEASLPPSARIRNFFSLKEIIEEFGDSLFGNKITPHSRESNLQPVSSEKSSETVLKVESNKLASSDVDTSSESKDLDARMEDLKYF